MWQYLVVSISTVGASVDSDRATVLANTGSQGWELVAVIRDSAVRDLAYFTKHSGKGD